MAMALRTGTTFDRMSPGGRLPRDRVGTLGIQVADASAEAHAIGILHRDIKPGKRITEELREAHEQGIVHPYATLAPTDPSP